MNDGAERKHTFNFVYKKLHFVRRCEFAVVSPFDVHLSVCRVSFHRIFLTHLMHIFIHNCSASSARAHEVEASERNLKVTRGAAPGAHR